ncbi:MAG: DNA gyrase subunit A [bacterium ADurb.Bin236]|nr:MAG: DNA gyrase subunit A [bacterium ADurb.Bin236]HOY62994.1 DNA gyrase subunit A [bacterium]
MTKKREEYEDRSTIVDAPVEEQMKTAYINYAMSVIVGRALPDVKDGLKPVHRRILYTMSDLGLTPGAKHRKSAKIVGDVMGRFHPHGDSAIYDALVRMAQDFNMRHTLVNGHGNFGSIDGDNAAAYRYTEARLDKLAMELLADIKMNTVDFVDNYEGTEKEPLALPARYPNLLVNGSSGIAVGMATSIPPHNLQEVVDATIAVVEEPEIEPEKLIKMIKGPDFPTYGEIVGKQGIKDAYLTGRGKVTLRGKIEPEETKTGKQRLVITEIPYMVNKSNMIEGLADLVRGKKIEGISDIRDESDRGGIRVIIELKKDANPYVIQNLIMKHTQMQTTFSIIMLALVNNEPKTLALKEMLEYFIEHRRDVVRRRTQFELDKAKARAHILEGLRIALQNIDEVIAIIKKSKDVATARETLMKRFELSEIQAQAILDLRLQKLTSLEQKAILDEYAELIKKIAELEDILANPRKVDAIIVKELTEIKEKYGEKRRTRIVVGGAEIDIEDLIQREDVVITVTRDGWVKRLPVDTYRTQGRGGRGVIGLTKKSEDTVKHLFVTCSHDIILFFSNRGQIYRMKAYQLPQAGRTAKGIPLVNLLQLAPAERITAVIPIKEFDDEHYLMMITKDGLVKKTKLSEYDTPRKGGIRAITLRQGDELRYVIISNGEREVVIGTRKGLSIRFKESDVRAMGRGAAGVRGIMLNRSDEVVGASIVDDDKAMLAVCENGYGKRTLLKYYRGQNRGGKGILNIKVSERNGDVVGIAVAGVEDELMMISEKGIIIRVPVRTISATIGRSTQGVRLMRMDESDKVVAFEVFKEEDYDDTVASVNACAPEPGDEVEDTEE